MRLDEVGLTRGLEEDEVEVDIRLDDDEFYGQDCGYWIIRMVRGNTTGRRIKRLVFKYGCYQLVCGVCLLLILDHLDRSYAMYDYHMVARPGMGSSVHNMMWLTAFPACLIAAWTMTMIYFWASLCTNRILLRTILQLYIGVSAFKFIFVLWATCIVFLAYKGVNFSKHDGMRAEIPAYVFSIIFMCTYLFAMFFHTLDLSYLIEELDYEDIVLEEPYPPQFDLEGLTLQNLCLGWLAVPIALGMQALDFFDGFKMAVQRYLAYRRRRSMFPTEEELEEKRRRKERKEKKTFYYRLKKTTRRWIKELLEPFRSKTMVMSNPGNDDGGEDLERQQQLLQAERDRQREEEFEREREAMERERLAAKEKKEREEKRKKEEEDARRKAEALRKQQEEEAAAAAAAAEAAAEAERKRQADEAAAAAESAAPTLSVTHFKALWGQLNTSGSFQCKLKTFPSLITLTDHLRKQGFHVVFAANTTSAEIEIGLCNIREGGQGSWFLARFLSSATSFSAVMKAEDPAQVTLFVKKFALARVLKIDTTK